MLKINLLPWRKDLRLITLKKRMRYSLSVLGLGLAVSISAYHMLTHIQKARMTHLAFLQQTQEQAITMKNTLKAIQFIGYLNQDNRIWAMLRMPNGEINDVRIGSDLGVYEAKIVSISREKVMVALPDNRLFTLPAQH